MPAISLPESPIHNCPLVSNGQAAGSVISFGRGGYRLPSRHTTVTGGRLPFAANEYVMREQAGAVSLNSFVDSASIRDGYPRLSVQNDASIEWQAISPRAPVPKSHQPRHLNGAYAGWYGRSGAGPSHNSQSSQDGVKYSSSGRSSACGQIGRLVHSWISRTVPMAPASTHSRIWRVPSSACPWLPICVATLYF